jgi:hypothetical protein
MDRCAMEFIARRWWRRVPQSTTYAEWWAGRQRRVRTKSLGLSAASC